MGAVYEGNLLGAGLRVAIVVARFNEFITGRLLDGCRDALRRHGVGADDVDVAWVPGALEIPLVTKRLAAGGAHDAIVTLGCVIRGATTHFDVVVSGVTRGVAAVAHETGVPCILGVLTTETIEQAIERAGTKEGNRGFAAAVNAIEMVNLLRQLPDAPA